MRTYVVYNKNTFILVGLGAIGLTCVILDCVSSILSMSHHRPRPTLVTRCTFQVSDATDPRPTSCESHNISVARVLYLISRHSGRC